MSIAQQIEAYTASISKFETSRSYVSLSQCVAPADELLKMFFDGFTDSPEVRLRCYKGYQMEKDLKERLIAMPDLNFTEHEEISAFDGLVLGHPDLQFHKTNIFIPCDCKSVPLDEHLPESLLPRRVYWQMQGYMLYAKKDESLVIYESRETGKIRDYKVRSNEGIQSEIHAKLQFVIGKIKSKAA